MSDDAIKTGMSAFTMFMMVLMFAVVVFVIWLIYSQFNKPKKIDIDVKTPGGMKMLDEKGLQYTTFSQTWKRDIYKVG
jgi:hypothetical protein